jgi:ribonucleotide reductase beta subunit family protein with ferritin-like domain
MQGGFWPPNINFDRDLESYERMGKAQQVYTQNILWLFNPLDEAVNQNLNDSDSILQRIGLKEATMCIMQISAQESVHSIVYSQAFIAILGHKAQREATKNIGAHPFVNSVLSWIRRYREGTDLLLGILMQYALEAVLFQPAFIAIRLLANNGQMPGLTTANDQVSRDENDHAKFWAAILVRYCSPSQEDAQAVLQEAVQLSDQFQEGALRDANKFGAVKHVSYPLMQNYVRYVADLALVEIGLEPMYGVDNPYPEVEAMRLNDVTIANFFEVKPTQYKLGADMSPPTSLDSIDKTAAAFWSAMA